MGLGLEGVKEEKEEKGLVCGCVDVVSAGIQLGVLSAGQSRARVT